MASVNALSFNPEIHDGSSVLLILYPVDHEALFALLKDLPSNGFFGGLELLIVLYITRSQFHNVIATITLDKWRNIANISRVCPVVDAIFFRRNSIDRLRRSHEQGYRSH